ncbi:unnamed protein product [marine sediment metagenome]|uniref:Uncharacterized protein n=1 Tax=marine sediment metagenome TaxID=412755 RepID=X0Z1W9_9ZZZZ
MFTTGCEEYTTPNYKDINNNPINLFNKQNYRREELLLLKELLIEMQETNSTLKRIEDRLDR